MWNGDDANNAVVDVVENVMAPLESVEEKLTKVLLMFLEEALSLAFECKTRFQECVQ